jgi:hypothetical protein
MGIGTLRRYHAPETAPEGAVSTVDGEKTAKTQSSPAKASNDAGVGVGIAKGKKNPAQGRGNPWQRGF